MSQQQLVKITRLTRFAYKEEKTEWVLKDDSSKECLTSSYLADYEEQEEVSNLWTARLAASLPIN